MIVGMDRTVTSVEDAVAELLELMSDECRKLDGPTIGAVYGEKIILLGPGFQMIGHYKYAVREAGLEVTAV